MMKTLWAVEAEPLAPPRPLLPCRPRPTALSDWISLTKPRIAALALITVAAGFAVAAGNAYDTTVLVHSLIGAALVAAAGGVFNQLLERDADARMERTAERPLPAGRIRPETAAAFGATLLGIGLGWLWAGTTLAATAVAALTFLLYVAVYTPMKRSSVWNTAIGAVPGALPPLIGWAAVDPPTGWAAAAGLFAILFLWQIPHFMAIAWMYREDYARGGLRMLPGVDPTGRRTAWVSLVCCGLLLVGGTPLAGLAGGWPAAIGAAVAGGIFALTAIRFWQTRNHQTARGLLRGSLLYVPLVYGIILMQALLT